MLARMQRHTRLINTIPVDIPLGGIQQGGLDPQQCFVKAMETVAALKSGLENKKYSVSELQRLHAVCLLTMGEMFTDLPIFHQHLLAEGRTKWGSEAVLAQMLKPDNSNNLGLIYVSPELVADVKEFKFGLGWDTSYRHCHHGLTPFLVLHMSLKHQQERHAVTNRLFRASLMTTEDAQPTSVWRPRQGGT
jgi:hypothetical protein